MKPASGMRRIVSEADVGNGTPVVFKVRSGVQSGPCRHCLSTPVCCTPTRLRSVYASFMQSSKHVDITLQVNLPRFACGMLVTQAVSTLLHRRLGIDCRTSLFKTPCCCMQNLTYTVDSNKERGKKIPLLKDITGCFSPHEMSALVRLRGSRHLRCCGLSKISILGRPLAAVTNTLSLLLCHSCVERGLIPAGHADLLDVR